MDDIKNARFAEAIAAYGESISQRTPGLNKICDEFRKAASKVEHEQRNRAFVEKRLWDRALFKIGIRKEHSISSNWKNEWSGSAFGVLGSRAAVLERRWKETPNVSARLTQAIAQALCDCEFVVRYFEQQLKSIQQSKSSQGYAASRLRSELHKVFVSQRDLLTFYEHRVLVLNNAQLQDYELDGRTGRELRQQGARGANAIRAKWHDPSGLNNGLDLENGTLEQSNAGSNLESCQGDSHQSWLGHLFRSYMWSLFPRSRALAGALCLACEEGDSKAVTRLLANGAYVNGTDENRLTPLICAIRRQHLDVIRLLLKNHADVNETSGAPPLVQAVETRNVQIVETLIRGSAEVDARSLQDERFRGVTALHRACELGLPDMVYLLLNQGADPTLTYCDHTVGLHKISPLHVAKGRCAHHIESITTDNQDYFRASAKDSQGRIPLFWALQREDWVALSACSPHWSTEKDAIDIDGNSAAHLLCERLAHSPLPSELKAVTEQVARLDSGRLRSSNKKGQTPLQILAASAAGRANSEGTDEDEVFVACKNILLRADLSQQNRATHPEDYVQPMMYCFGTGPTLTKEKMEENWRQFEVTKAHEDQTLVEQTALFESLMAESNSQSK